MIANAKSHEKRNYEKHEQPKKTLENTKKKAAPTQLIPWSPSYIEMDGQQITDHFPQ